jgi:nickel-dependent lactate racemase
MDIKTIALGYGRGKVNLRIPSKNLKSFITPDSRTDRIAKYGMIGLPVRNVLDQAVKSSSIDLSDFVSGVSVCCIIEDCTRKEPHEDIMEVIVPYLKKSRFVRFIIGTGSHDPMDDENQKIMHMISRVASRHALNFEVMANDSRSDLGKFHNVGVSTNGNDILVNKSALYDDRSNLFERRVIVADMKAHYFAGYSNALKDFLPAICYISTIERNHSLALDPRSTFTTHPWHNDDKKRDNPLANEMLEATLMIEPNLNNVYTIAIISSGDGIVWAKAGNIKTVTQEGIKVIDDLTGFQAGPANHVIISPGGYPNDREIYTAQRSLELTKNAVMDGAEILWIAKFENGISTQMYERENFYDLLVGDDGLEKVLSMKRSDYTMYSHKAFKFAELIKRVGVIHVYSSLEPKAISDIHMSPVSDPQTVVDNWLGKNPNAKIIVFDGANKLTVQGKL